MAKKDEAPSATLTTVTVVSRQDPGRYRCKAEWYFTREPKVVQATDAELEELRGDLELVVIEGDTTGKPADTKPAA
jgi:hypothetical protein